MISSRIVQWKSKKRSREIWKERERDSHEKKEAEKREKVCIFFLVPFWLLFSALYGKENNK